MRALIGLTILVTLFAMAVAWQDRWTESLKRRRDHMRTSPVLASSPQSGWSRLVIGRPSGAPIPEADEVWEEEPLPLSTRNEFGLVEPPPEPEAEPHEAYVVAPGDYLGSICLEYYGTARPTVLDAVAAYNGITDLNAIREGDRIFLPDAGSLPGARE